MTKIRQSIILVRQSELGRVTLSILLSRVDALYQQSAVSNLAVDAIH